MSTTANPQQIDPRMLEETRRQLSRLIEEVGRLSESELPSRVFSLRGLWRLTTAR